LRSKFNPEAVLNNPMNRRIIAAERPPASLRSRFDAEVPLSPPEADRR